VDRGININYSKAAVEVSSFESGGHSTGSEVHTHHIYT